MKELYPFQQRTVSDLLLGKHFVVATMGTGKTAMMFGWLKHQTKAKVLIVTVASKRDSHEFENEADDWCGDGYKASLSFFEVISWHGLAKWVKAHKTELADWAYAFDECHRAKAGVSSGMGRAFLEITRNTNAWTAYTGTPGDTWLAFYPYFTACKLVKHKTEFLRNFAEMQTFKGYPEIVAWRHEDVMDKWWRQIASIPDTSAVFKEMPKETHTVIPFKRPATYMRVKKTRITEDGEELDTTMALCHHLRQLCFTKEKKQWLSDFIEGLGTNAIVFYTYIDEGDEIEALAKKVLPKGARVWRIDGKRHEIPTEQTIGKYDIVLSQWESGSNSLNLQFINYWVSSTPNYSFSTSLQARGRIKRIGQKKPMFFYYLKCEDSIEDAIYQCLKGKSDFSEEVWAAREEL